MARQIASTFLSLVLAVSTVNAHAFFHTGYVNDVSQGHLFGVRAPASNSPIQDVTSSAMTCNSPLYQPVSTDVIEVAPGDKFGMQWNHNLAGPTPGDSDDPIAASHKGPVMVYMAKVDDAATADGSGTKWFKVAEEGLDTSTGLWGVDTLLANKGLWSFTMPTLAAGEYLLRGEVLALHSAGSEGQAQFYMSCAAIKVTGSGTCAPSDTVSIPGAYSATDPGILISIYGNTGKPDNGGKAYAIPGPAVAACDGSSAPASSSSVAASSSTTTKASVSVSGAPTTANNVASTTSKVADATSTSAQAVKSSSTITSTTTSASAAASSSTLTSTSTFTTTSDSTTTPRSVLPTTFATVTSRNSTNWSWSRPENTRTRSSSSLSTSGQPTTSAASSSEVMATATSAVGITASATQTVVKVPTVSGSDDQTASATGVTGTSPAMPSGSGYSMTGPGGKKFVCYEVTDF